MRKTPFCRVRSARPSQKRPTGNPMVAPRWEDTAASLGREQVFDYTIRRKDSPPRTGKALTSQRVNAGCLVRFLMVVASLHFFWFGARWVRFVFFVCSGRVFESVPLLSLALNL